MRTTLLLATLFLITSTTKASLILTGIIDGPLPGGTPKAIELFVTSDIADLSEFGLELVSNAGSSSGARETSFSGSASAGDFIYVASEDTEFFNVFGFNPDFVESTHANHNGDDDFYIYGPGDVLIDVWGGSDGVDNTGTDADILDSYAYRNDGAGPNTTFTASEWDIQPTNTLDGLDAAGTAAAFPFGTYTPAAIPEPTSLVVLMPLIAALVYSSRRKRALF